METFKLSCRVCQATFVRIHEIKSHMLSKMHKKKMEEVFKKDEFCGHGFPPIVMINRKREIKQPIIGLSLLTLCFSQDMPAFFYLCHVCEEKCLPENILGHLSSGDHYSNYFTFVNPNVLRYSWIPSMSMRDILRKEILKEISKAETRQLQMLDLPKELLKKLVPCTYSKVIQSLSENDKILKLLEAVESKRVMLQKYQKDTTRKHPLLGMQHIVECVCVGPAERRHYLCTLCNLTFSTHMVIKHVLSFDHIFGYFRAWHPSTLLSKESYTDYPSFASIILNLAKQAEEIHGAENTDLKQVKLEPAEYTAINFASYKEALKNLESIRRKKEESSLVTDVTPGQKLECPPVGQHEPQLPVPLRICCQECNINFESIAQYLKHLKSLSHQQVLKEHFGNKVSSFKQGGRIPFLKSYSYLRGCWRSHPAIGVSLVVTCLSSEAPDEPVCVCFACSESFLDSAAETHFTSQKHITNTLLHLNPWRLPLGWIKLRDLAALGSSAREEEKERDLHHTAMKILDVPSCMLKDLKPPSYSKVLMTLKQHYTLLKREVPPSETRTKLKDRERFPLLGREFLVKFNVSVGKNQIAKTALLCMLCQKRVSFKEAHVFGHEHIKTFIRCFHPGSLKPKTDTETLLDLAKQALCHHPVLNIQEIELVRPIQEPFTYQTACVILQAAKTRQGKGKLSPPIAPKMQLFPRGSLKDTDSPVDSSMEENTEKKCPVSADFPVDMKVEFEGSITQYEENTEQKVDLKNLTSAKDSVKTVKEEIEQVVEMSETIKREKVEMPILSEPSDEKTESCEDRQTDLSPENGEQCGKNLTHFKNFLCKEEETETLISASKELEDTCLRDVSKKIKGSEQNRFVTEAQSLQSGRQKEETIAEEEETKTAEEKEETRAVEDGSKTSVQSVKNQASRHQHPDQLWQYIKTKDREPVIGLDALLECYCDQHNPIYLCICCSVKILQKDIISHVTGVHHQKMYLLLKGFEDLQSLPGAHKGMRISHYSALYEKHHGYGDAEVFDLDEDVYHSVLTQNFESALQTMNALKAQQSSVCEPILTSVFSAAHTSLTPATRHALSYVKDNYQCLVLVPLVFCGRKSEDSESNQERSPVVHENFIQMMSKQVLILQNTFEGTKTVMDMEVEGGSEEENTSSKTSTKTPEVAPDLSKDVKMTLGKKSDLAHSTISCQTVVKSEEAASPSVSTTGTNTTCLQHDFRLKTVKLEVTSDIAVSSRREEKNVESSQGANTSDTAVTTSIKAMTAISQHTAKAPSSALENFNITEPSSYKLTANISSFTAAKSGKCAASTSSSSATTFKCSTANSSKSSTIQLNADNLKTTGASAATKSTEGNPGTSTLTITTAAATNRGLQTTSPSGILATTKSSKTTHKISKSVPSHCATNKESTTTNKSNITSTNKFTAPTNSCNATKTNSREAAYKCATSKLCASAMSTKPTGANPYTSTSETTSTSKLEQVSKPVTGKTGVSTTAKVKSTVVQETSCRHPPAAISQAVVSSLPAAELSVKAENTKATSKTAVKKKSGGSNADVAQNNSSTASKDALTIGLNYGIKVSCGKRLQVYCRVCSCRLRRAGHFRSYRHKYNYVKMKYPSWTANQSEMKSKLDKIVAHLAEIEKDVETKDPEKLEVDLNTYKELGDPLLSEDKAFEKLMEKMRQKDSGVSSSTADSAEVWTPDTAFSNSPEILSPDDEIYLWQTETAGLYPEIQSEKKEVLQAHHAKIPEGETASGDERPLAAGHSNTLEKNLDLKAEHMAVTQSHHLSHPQNQGAKTPESGTALQTFNLESSPISQVINASQETPEKTNQRKKSDPEIQVTPKKLEDSERTSPVKYSNPGKLLSAASVNTGQQNQSRSSQTVKQEPPQLEWSSRPEHHCAPQAPPKIAMAGVSWGCSNLSTFLAVKRLDSEPIIGLGAVWECRGLQQKTFYLCASCSERLFIGDICKHMISDKHQLNHMLKEYSRLMEFWSMNNLQPEMQKNIFREIVMKVSMRERKLKKDAQYVLLPQDLIEYVKTAPFSEALKFLQDFKTNQRVSVICPPSSALPQKDQLPAEDQSQAGSQSTEIQFAQASKTDKTSDEVRQETEEQPYNRIIQREVLSPSEETSVCSEADSLVAQVPEAGTSQRPQETSNNLSELRLPTIQQITGLHVKPTELCPESPSFPPSPNDGPVLPVFAGDKRFLTRKRSTDTSVEALAWSCMGNPQLEEPFPPKRTCSSLLPSTKSAPESSFVPPAANATLLSVEDKNTETGPETFKTGLSYLDLYNLVDVIRSELKMSLCEEAQPNCEPSRSCATNPSVGMKINLRPEFEQTSFEAPAKKKRWDVEPQLDNAADNTSLPSATTANSREQQNQGSGDAQSMWGKINSFKAGKPISEDTSCDPEPGVTTELINRGVSQLPICSIVTPRLDHRQRQLMAWKYTTSTYQGEGYITSGAHQSQGWKEVMQPQQFIQQQPLVQHQYMYPPSTSGAPANMGTYGTAYQGSSHPSGQQFTNFPQYKQVQHPNNSQQP